MSPGCAETGCWTTGCRGAVPAKIRRHFIFLTFHKNRKRVPTEGSIKLKSNVIHRTAKTQYRNFETNIPRKGTARLQSQFLHSCFCERFIYSSDWSACSAVGKYLGERGNWDWGRAIPFLWTHKFKFVCSANTVLRRLYSLQDATKKWRLSCSLSTVWLR